MSARMLSEKLKVSRATAGRALQELAARGFIECIKKGGFNVKFGTGRSAEWRLTVYKCDVTADRASRKFMYWQEGQFHFTVSPQSHPGLTTGPDQ